MWARVMPALDVAPYLEGLMRALPASAAPHAPLMLRRPAW